MPYTCMWLSFVCWLLNSHVIWALQEYTNFLISLSSGITWECVWESCGAHCRFVDIEVGSLSPPSADFFFFCQVDTAQPCHSAQAASQPRSGRQCYSRVAPHTADKCPREKVRTYISQGLCPVSVGRSMWHAKGWGWGFEPVKRRFFAEHNIIDVRKWGHIHVKLMHMLLKKTWIIW